MDQCPRNFKRNILFFSSVYSRKSCFFSFVEFLQWIYSDYVYTIGKNWHKNYLNPFLRLKQPNKAIKSRSFGFFSLSYFHQFYLFQILAQTRANFSRNYFFSFSSVLKHTKSRWIGVFCSTWARFSVVLLSNFKSASTGFRRWAGLAEWGARKKWD